MQIIDAQKARLKRELETLQGRLHNAAAAKERADTLACQLRADLADAWAERDASVRQHERSMQQMQKQIADLESQRQHETRPATVAQPSKGGKENHDFQVSSTCQTFFVCIASQGHHLMLVKHCECQSQGVASSKLVPIMTPVQFSS